MNEEQSIRELIEAIKDIYVSIIIVFVCGILFVSGVIYGSPSDALKPHRYRGRTDGRHQMGYWSSGLDGTLIKFKCLFNSNISHKKNYVPR